jgi:polyisoprenoid-binding protein YceI
MKTYFFSALLFAVVGSASAQTFITRNAYIKFFGSTPMENIEAVSNQASSVIDVAKSELAFQVVLNTITFEKALMQEHFNENYVESEKYPKCIFRGKIVGAVDYAKPGTYKVTLSGKMNLHGVEKDLDVPATIIVEKDGLKLSSEFKMVPEDYKIAIPGAVRDKIAKEMAVTVKAAYKPS